MSPSLIRRFQGRQSPENLASSLAEYSCVTRNNTGITRRDVPRDVASPVANGGGLHNATPGCIGELKNGGNGRASADGVENVPLRSPARVTYLTSLKGEGYSRKVTPLTPSRIVRIAVVVRCQRSRLFYSSFTVVHSFFFSFLQSLTHPFPSLTCLGFSPLARFYFDSRFNFPPWGGRLRADLLRVRQTRIKRAIDVGKSPGNLPTLLVLMNNVSSWFPGFLSHFPPCLYIYIYTFSKDAIRLRS